MKTQRSDSKHSLWAAASLLLLLAAMPAFGQAAGAKGGDTCEMRIQEIIEEGLKAWINDPSPEDGKVGPDGFEDRDLFREGVELRGETRAERIADYITRMNAQIKERKFFTRKQLEGVSPLQGERLLVIECVKTERPAEVNVDLSDLGQPEFRSFERVCWNSGGDGQIAQITCDREVFDRLNWDPKVNADLQYSLIHHEVAGLAGIEGNFRYGLSRVISEFMETREVRMLGRRRHPGGDAGEGDLTDIARDDQGNVLHKNQYEAERYCRDHDSRLPTARELALWAVKHGASISDHPRDGYYKVDGSDPEGRLDPFYFNYSGYRAPDGEFGKYWYWSSSVVPGDSNNAYDLSGDNGYIVYVGRSDSYDGYAVRCVRPR